MGGYDRPGRDLCEDLNTRILALPGIMRQQHWRVSALLMARWLNLPACMNPEHGAHDTMAVRMDWVLRFPQAYPVYAAAKANKVWVNEAAQEAIKDKLIDKKGRLPQKVGERLEIGSVGEGLVRSGPGMARFHKDWQIQFREVKQSLFSPMLNDLYGALGDFSFYFAVKGHVERIADENGQPRYKVTLSKVGAYVMDKYDFNDDLWFYSQPLGQWRCVPPSVGKLPKQDTYYVNNADFRKWRERYGHGRGGDFLVFSDIRRFDTDDSFVFPQDEGQP